jgi:hypothetical protein
MSTYAPERLSGRAVNLSSRIVSSKAVVGSPATNAETIVASVTLPLNVQTFQAVELQGWVAFTVGTSGVSADLKIRQTDTSGTVIADSGLCTVVATNLDTFSIMGTDPTPAGGQVYKLTLTIGSGAATSTVSAVYLRALIV